MQKNITKSEATNPAEFKKESKLATLYVSSKFISEDDTPSPPEIIKNGILGIETLLIIGGKPKSRKSFLAFNLAISIASGVGFSIFEVGEPRKVLVFSAEGGYYSNRDRIKKMMLNCPKIVHENLGLYFGVNENILEKDSFNAISDEIIKYKPEVVIIDPLVRFHNAEENSATEMSKLFGKIRGLISKHNISIIIIHHQGKDESKGGTLRGSSVISGEYDSIIKITKDTSNENKHSLSFDLRHAESPDSTDMYFNSETFWFESTEKANAITEVLSKEGELSKSDLADKLVANGNYKQKQSAYKPIKRAEECGLIVFSNITKRYKIMP